MLSEDQKVFKITATATITVRDKTCYFLALLISVADAGTLAVTVQDKAAPPNKLLPAIDLTLGTDSDALVKQWTAPQPVRMEGGIDIRVTAGTGEAYLWVFYLFEPELQT